ncbi:MAG: lytic transglycosylase domain-containing protein [Nitrososphaerota archaeon]
MIRRRIIAAIVGVILVFSSRAWADVPGRDQLYGATSVIAKNKCDPIIFLYVLDVKLSGGSRPAGRELLSEAQDIACALDMASRTFAKRNAVRFNLTEKLAKSLIVGVAHQESAFVRHAVSHKDAVGIMQVHWPTWGEVLRRVGLTRSDLYNPYINALVGAYILEDCLVKTNGKIERALGCYFGKDSKGYVAGVLSRSKRFVLTALALSKANIGNEEAKDGSKEE